MSDKIPLQFRLLSAAAPGLVAPSDSLVWDFTLQEGEWNFRARPSVHHGWYGEARRGEWTADQALNEPVTDEVWFEFAPTRKEVILKLKAEVWS